MYMNRFIGLVTSYRLAELRCALLVGLATSLNILSRCVTERADPRCLSDSFVIFVLFIAVFPVIAASLLFPEFIHHTAKPHTFNCHRVTFPTVLCMSSVVSGFPVLFVQFAGLVLQPTTRSRVRIVLSRPCRAHRSSIRSDGPRSYSEFSRRLRQQATGARANLLRRSMRFYIGRSWMKVFALSSSIPTFEQGFPNAKCWENMQKYRTCSYEGRH